MPRPVIEPVGPPIARVLQPENAACGAADIRNERGIAETVNRDSGVDSGTPRRLGHRIERLRVSTAALVGTDGDFDRAGWCCRLSRERSRHEQYDEGHQGGGDGSKVERHQ